MWRVDHGPTRAGASRSRRATGYTFLEIVIVLSILTTMALVVEKAIHSTTKTQLYLASVRKATERGHGLVYEIREKVTSSRRIFFDDDSGNDFLAAMDLSRNPAVEWARLPTANDLGRLGPDEAGQPMTGNILFFVGETDATPTVADPSQQTIRYIDTYYFSCIYPHQTDRYVVLNESHENALDLIIWQSVEFPDYAQIMAISDAGERAQVVDDLKKNHGHDVAWDPTGDVGNSFYSLDDLKGTAARPLSSMTVPEDDATSRGGRLVYTNVQLARADINERRRRPIFATDDPNVWLPHGFEVKVIGPTGSRQVWYHLAVEVQSGTGQVAVHSSTLVANARDL